jgi:glycosyltransferase involved in cell wall biosynthesis
MNICYANTIDYEHPFQQRPHHLMNELAKRGHKIFWVNEKKNENIFRTRINENLSVYHNWNKFVEKFRGEIDVYFASWSHRWVDVAKLQPKMAIYDSLDLFPQNESQEKNMVNVADVLLTTTTNLYDYHKQHTDKPIYRCENGCFPKYRNLIYETPKDIKDIQKPIVLFTGAMAIDPKMGWVDFELIDRISQKYNMVVVGGLWGVSQEFMVKHKQIFSRIKFVGTKDYDTLQKYYATCDVNLLPFKRCQTADYSDPLKVIEGCNHGKISVVTDIPSMVQLNKQCPNSILVSKNHDEFLKNIDLAIRNSTNKDIINEAIGFADTLSWNSRVDIIENAIKQGWNKLW